MSIIMDKDAVFHLQTKKTSYILAVVGGEYLAHVYVRCRTKRVSKHFRWLLHRC